MANQNWKVEALTLAKTGKSWRKIAKELEVSKSTVSDYLRKAFKDSGGEFGLKLLQSVKEMDEGKVGRVTEVVEQDNRYVSQLNGFIENRGAEKLVTTFRYPIVTSDYSPEGCNHFVIPDTQAKPGIDFSYFTWVGKYIVDRKPQVIVHLGDHADFPSLSSYDKGKKSAEGKRVTSDINAAIHGMELLLKPLYDYQQKELAEFGEIRYKPRMVFLIGNHCERLKRHVDANPELHGLLSYDSLLYKEAGWEVFDFLQTAIVNGVGYCHFMANPMTGKPFSGTAANILQKVGESFTMGHRQVLDTATRFLPNSGRQQWGLIAGACYPHAEGYKGYGGNHHWRGVVIKHKVTNGSYNPMFVDLDYLKKKFN